MTQPSPASQHPAFIGYPAQAAFGRTLPKNKVYEHSGANTRLKDLFVRQVEQIVWAFKLAPETIRLPARPGVPEIQVFSLQLKTPELHRDVLRCIDGAIPFPIMFELAFEGIAKSARHKSGLAVRFPRILRWRRDKPASEADTVERAEALLKVS